MHKRQSQCQKSQEVTVMFILLLGLKATVLLVYSWLEALVKFFVPKRRKSVSGEIVLITGAAHGLGRATAYEFAKRQSKMVLWDINKQGVEETAEECRKLGTTAHAFVVDCKNRDEIYRAAEKVKRDVGDVSILVNNAGVITSTTLLSTKDAEIQNMFDVNILAHYWTMKAFLPAMMEHNHGHIVTVASFSGLMAFPCMVTYSSTKFAAVGFHEGLKEELRVLGKDGIKSTCLCPVIMNTGFFRLKSFVLFPTVEAEETAKALMEGILTNQEIIVFPSWMKFSPAISRILPKRVSNLFRDVEKEACQKLF
ncbi:17-beta-hydroxysteroid dehydrogenase 13-like [Elgaria multicarinata webbii]|uniref:17-beta-hydroxysteroid dehydrogenase 13-like n=1 Tax=Elgaria multicarinata webbii TaxID=159646 RepID=UPI002FCCBFF6